MAKTQIKRVATVERNTSETAIKVKLDLDGTGKSKVHTGIGFFDHMLVSFSKHSKCDLEINCKGDLHIDAHHTVEDTGLVLGTAFEIALGDKKGLKRYGTGFHPKNPLFGEAYLPMDECLSRCVIDFCGRPYLVMRGMDRYSQKKISVSEKNQDMSSAFRFGLVKEFFYAFSSTARCNLHLQLLYGEEPHHIVESLFKAFARAVDEAKMRDPRLKGVVPSTKGTLSK
ncbi:MAG: imidazoleglycerol-phosphate dehydratase HisB [Verrucomicrobiota bacterium]|nr:imidazoleglycerol-phosphate dehydratase HisB [Verrucomicrobiota bacterium]